MDTPAALKMHFIFRHRKFSRYKNKRGKVYHYDRGSPNWEKVKVGVKVLCYQIEKNEIFGIAEVREIEERAEGFFALLKNYVRLRKPLVVDLEVMKKVKLGKSLGLPAPGIIPISRSTYSSLLKLIREKNKYIKLIVKKDWARGLVV